MWPSQNLFQYIRYNFRDASIPFPMNHQLSSNISALGFSTKQLVYKQLNGIQNAKIHKALLQLKHIFSVQIIVSCNCLINSDLSLITQNKKT